jgi:dihydrodipicolinate synthase/N-acetylneuraminate lyase
MRMIAEIRPIRQDFFFMTGWDATLVPMLMIGCDGGTNATSGVVPELTRSIYEAARAGQWERAMQIQYKLLPLFDTMLSTAEFPEGFRRGAKIRGWDLGQSRQPLTPQQVNAADATQGKLQELLSSFDFMQNKRTTLSNANPNNASMADDSVIDRIVSEVLQQLRAN